MDEEEEMDDMDGGADIADNVMNGGISEDDEDFGVEFGGNQEEEILN